VDAKVTYICSAAPLCISKTSKNYALSRGHLMTQIETSSITHRIYRVDKFVVPNQAREEFLTQVKNTHQLLKAQPGFIQDFLLEQPADSEEFNVITIVEWQDTRAIENARAAVMAMHKSTGFNPQEMFVRLGIKADLGNYKPINA
jgi:heme-degrading monooxygenase HmoA